MGWINSFYIIVLSGQYNVKCTWRSCFVILMPHLEPMKRLLHVSFQGEKVSYFPFVPCLNTSSEDLLLFRRGCYTVGLS